MINGKTIVLTGASSGIGLEVLKLLVQGTENRILAVSRHAVEKLTNFAPNVTPFDADVSSPEGIESIFDKAESMFGKIDIFYANAGYPYYERYDYLDWERVEAMFRTNTFAPMSARWPCRATPSTARANSPRRDSSRQCAPRNPTTSK